jgi:hypothetical protein
MQAVCTPRCALELTQRNNAKASKQRLIAERKQRLAQREAIKTRGDWAREAQAAFNLWIRERDYGLPCISCGQPATQGQRHASHYRSVGAAPQHRFNPLNVHASCAQCNQIKSGNIVEYRIALVQKITAERVEHIEHSNERKTYSIETLKRIKRLFGRRARNYRKWRESKRA